MDLLNKVLLEVYQDTYTHSEASIGLLLLKVDFIAFSNGWA